MDVGVKIGDVVDGYKIIGLIHKGGMGVIFKARDIKKKRFAALKFPYIDFGADARVFDAYKKRRNTVRGFHTKTSLIYTKKPLLRQRFIWQWSM